MINAELHFYRLADGSIEGRTLDGWHSGPGAPSLADRLSREYLGTRARVQVSRVTEIESAEQLLCELEGATSWHTSVCASQDRQRKAPCDCWPHDSIPYSAAADQFRQGYDGFDGDEI